MNTRTTKLVGLAVAALLVLASCGGGSDDADEHEPAGDTERTITTTAVGDAVGIPDNLTANVSVATGASTANEALTENNLKTQALIDSLKGAGIDPADMATTEINLGPTHDDDGNITGYRASNSLQVTMRDLDTAGAQLDGLVAAVGDAGRLGAIRLGFNNDEALRSEARTAAVKQATAQATEMAEAAGAELGKVQTIVEVIPESRFADEGSFALASIDRASVPIEAGSQELTVRVEVIYALT